MSDVLDFLTAPMSTDELKRQVETLREQLSEKASKELRLNTALNDVNLDLDRIQARTNFLVSLTGQLLELSQPPAAHGLEAHYAAKKSNFYDPVEYGITVTGLAGVGLVALGSFILPGTAKLLGAVFRSTTIAGASKATWMVKMAKVGRAGVYLAIATSILTMAMKMGEAQKINAYLKEKRAEFEAQADEADRVLARYEVAIEQAEIYRDGLLADAGVKTVQEYLGLINDAIKDVAEQSASARMARNLLRMGTSQEDVLTLIPRLDAAGLSAIARRLAAEIALIEGEDAQSVAQKTELTALQVAIVERVLAARGDAALGARDVELVERHKISDAVADLQIDLADAALPGIWKAVQPGGDLTGAALKALIPRAALEQLQIEIAARGALWAGESLEAVVRRFPALDASRVEVLAADLQAGPAVGGKVDAQTKMIDLRLPFSAVPAPVA